MINKNVLKFILGLKIKNLRTQLGLSLKELSEKSHLSPSYLNEIEKGKKYPKVEKLAALAQSLNVDMGDLVSSKTGRMLSPLLKFLESDLVKNLPFNLFGLKEQDVTDVISHSPEKFASFILTVLEISRSNNLNLDDVYQAALRSHVESHDNYFLAIEQKALAAKKEWKLPNKRLSENRLKGILIDRYNYQIDETTLAANDLLKEMSALSKREGKPVLYLNSKLDPQQKIYFLAKELGFIRFFNPLDDLKNGYLTLLNDFRSSYFAGALIIDEQLFVKDLRTLFLMRNLDTQFISNLMEKYQASPEVFFHRLGQLAPTFFKLNQLFFLRLNLIASPDSEEKLYMSKEMHLSKLHIPHGVKGDEHYCRRWISYHLIKKLQQKMAINPSERLLINSQISVMQEDGGEYFCLSLAKPSQTKMNNFSCLTIGFLLDEVGRKTFNFLSHNKRPPKIIVAQTCERCPLVDCQQRAADPIVVNEEALSQQKKKLIAELLGK